MSYELTDPPDDARPPAPPPLPPPMPLAWQEPPPPTRHGVEFHGTAAGTIEQAELFGVIAAEEGGGPFERAIREEVNDALITIHVEPEDKAKLHGVVVL